jgi:hypothetical protein
MKWETYLEVEGFKDEIVDGLERKARDLVAGQAQAAQRIADAQQAAATTIRDSQQQTAQKIASAQYETAQQIMAAEAETARTLNEGFGSLIASQDQLQTVMEQGLAAVAYGVEDVAGGIEALRADFDWAMGALLWKFELQQDTLQNILTTLQAPLDTEAKELRKRAEFAYEQGWYEEALRDFLASEEKNYQDFAIHQAIGNIYLYHTRPAELPKARAYYENAGKYASPRSAYHAALGYLHAGFVCYLQGDDAAAIAHARRAVDLDPEMLEAHYNLAKFAAAAGQVKVAFPALETAIQKERTYAVKAWVDADFANIKTTLARFMEALYSDAKHNAQREWRSLKEKIDGYELAPEDQQLLQSDWITEIESFMDADTYFGYRSAYNVIWGCKMMLGTLNLPERDRLRGEATRMLSQLQSEMEACVLPRSEKEEMNDELQVIISSLSRPVTYAKAKAVRDKVIKCEEAFQTQCALERNRLRHQITENIEYLRDLHRDHKRLIEDIFTETFRRHIKTELAYLESLAASEHYADIQKAYEKSGKYIEMLGRAREERRRRLREERESFKQQREIWRSSNCCEICGARLGLFARLLRRTRCKVHRW